MQSVCSRVWLLLSRTPCRGFGQECLDSLTANGKFCPWDKLTSCPGAGWGLSAQQLCWKGPGAPCGREARREFTWMVMKAKASLACITTSTARRLKEEFIALCLKTWRFQLDVREKDIHRLVISGTRSQGGCGISILGDLGPSWAKRLRNMVWIQC